MLIDGVAQRSCLTLAVQAEGREVRTVESLAAPDGTLNPLQQAFRNNHALQCGFCTPGILMSFTDFLARNPHPTEAEIREVLSGHLCRCTGYAGIVAAIKEVLHFPPRDSGEGSRSGEANCSAPPCGGGIGRRVARRFVRVDDHLSHPHP